MYEDDEREFRSRTDATTREYLALLERHAQADIDAGYPTTAQAYAINMAALVLAQLFEGALSDPDSPRVAAQCRAIVQRFTRIVAGDRAGLVDDAGQAVGGVVH